jgi:hypothetical protein
MHNYDESFLCDTCFAKLQDDEKCNHHHVNPIPFGAPLCYCVTSGLKEQSCDIRPCSDEDDDAMEEWRISDPFGVETWMIEENDIKIQK